jgi:hypothetical protein
MKISLEVARFLVKLDSAIRGYPLSQEEIEYQIHDTKDSYTLINGDVISYYNRSWRIFSFASYAEAIK